MKVAGAFGLFHRIRVASVHVNRISRFMALFVPRIHESRSIVKASSISWREKADKRYNVLYIFALPAHDFSATSKSRGGRCRGAARDAPR